MMPAFFGVRLLGRSYLILILMVAVLITGMSTGFGLFYRLLYALVLTTVLSYVWNWLTMRSLEVKVEWRTRQARAGDTIEEMISVRNNSKLPKAGLEVDVLTDLPGYTGGMVLNLMETPPHPGKQRPRHGSEVCTDWGRCASQTAIPSGCFAGRDSSARRTL